MRFIRESGLALGRKNLEDATLERGTYIIFNDVVANQDPTFKAAIKALEKAFYGIVVLYSLFSPMREKAILQQHFNILLVEPRHFSHNANGFTFQRISRHAATTSRTRLIFEGQETHGKAIEYSVKQEIHLSQQRRQRTLCIGERSHNSTSTATRNQISHTHRKPHN